MQAQNLDLASRYAHINARKAERCAACGTYLAFAVYKNAQTQELKRILSEANFCKARFCPMCAWLKAKKQISYFYRVFKAIEAKRRVGYIFLHLTIKNAPLEALKCNLGHMSKAWHKLVKRKAFKNAFLGFVRATEFIGDQTPPHECHPHYHAILVAPSRYFVSELYLSQAKITALWQASLKVPYTPIVHVNRIRLKKPKKGKALAQINPQDNALLSSLLECVKYCVKPAKVAKLSQAQFAILDEQSKGAHQYDSGGIVKETPPLEQDDLDPEVWEYLKTEYFTWCGMEYKRDEEVELLQEENLQAEIENLQEEMELLQEEIKSLQENDDI
ncbi:protein rep [Arcobacter sp. L]|uniref:protein rep n=1 Tax=Arcobacter sp. L TaxID=944547 RepID=UPI0002296735|nr:protein rep [Arcobacter sp. L]BAK74723.1 replication protein [Arcobacter sp. L]